MYKMASGQSTKSSKNRSKEYKVGDYVELSKGQMGTIKYIGKTDFSRNEIMYGIEYIDGTIGKHNGTVKNKVYFNGLPDRCCFVKIVKIRKKLTKLQKNQAIQRHSLTSGSVAINGVTVASPRTNSRSASPLPDLARLVHSRDLRSVDSNNSLSNSLQNNYSSGNGNNNLGNLSPAGKSLQGKNHSRSISQPGSDLVFTTFVPQTGQRKKTKKKDRSYLFDNSIDDDDDNEDEKNEKKNDKSNSKQSTSTTSITTTTNNKNNKNDKNVGTSKSRKSSKNGRLKNKKDKEKEDKKIAKTKEHKRQKSRPTVFGDPYAERTNHFLKKTDFVKKRDRQDKYHQRVNSRTNVLGNMDDIFKDPGMVRSRSTSNVNSRNHSRSNSRSSSRNHSRKSSRNLLMDKRHRKHGSNTSIDTLKVFQNSPSQLKRSRTLDSQAMTGRGKRKNKKKGGGKKGDKNDKNKNGNNSQTNNNNSNQNSNNNKRSSIVVDDVSSMVSIDSLDDQTFDKLLNEIEISPRLDSAVPHDEIIDSSKLSEQKGIQTLANFNSISTIDSAVKMIETEANNKNNANNNNNNNNNKNSGHTNENGNPDDVVSISSVVINDIDLDDFDDIFDIPDSSRLDSFRNNTATTNSNHNEQKGFFDEDEDDDEDDDENGNGNGNGNKKESVDGTVENWEDPPTLDAIDSDFEVEFGPGPIRSMSVRSTVSAASSTRSYGSPMITSFMWADDDYDINSSFSKTPKVGGSKKKKKKKKKNKRRNNKNSMKPIKKITPMLRNNSLLSPNSRLASNPRLTSSPNMKLQHPSGITVHTPNGTIEIKGFHRRQASRKFYSHNILIGNIYQLVDGRVGICLYNDIVKFNRGNWIGLELIMTSNSGTNEEDSIKGDHNGTVDGHTYFVCRENRGIFVQSNQVCRCLGKLCFNFFCVLFFCLFGVL